LLKVALRPTLENLRLWAQLELRAQDEHLIDVHIDDEQIASLIPPIFKVGIAGKMST
jgi:hypothetical protein